MPFHYLVPDARMLPAESVRFFYLDRTWTDRLVDGAMAAGAVGNGELELAQEVAAAARASLDTACGSYGQQVTGFLLRSTLVRRWPRMEVRAYRVPGSLDTSGGHPRNLLDGDSYRLNNLRIARLSEGILLALWHGVPNYVEIEEPKHGVQFGVNRDEENPTVKNVEPRSLDTGEIFQQNGNNVEITIRYRAGGAQGVVDINRLATDMAAGISPFTSDTVDSRMMGMALQQMPFIQPFRDGTAKGEAYYPPQPPANRPQMLAQLALTVPIYAKAYAKGTPVAANAAVNPVDPGEAVKQALQEGVAFLNNIDSKIDSKLPGGK